jgi:hypothetical protein
MEQSFVNFVSSISQPGSSKGFPETQEEDSQTGQSDHPIVTKEKTTLYDGMRMPALIENLQRLQLPEVSNQDEINLFHLYFLKEMLGGDVLPHGRYSIASNNQPNGGVPRSFPAVREWAAFARDYEPLLPPLPTQHGVKISSFIQYSEETEPFPLFIREKDSTRYVYYGHYQELRRSDRVGGCEMSQLPEYVKEHWAEKLGSRGKGLKHITALRKMWPMVKVGWWDKETRSMIDYDEKLEDEQGELEVVKRHITESEAEALTAEQILAAFDVVSVPLVSENQFSVLIHTSLTRRCLRHLYGCSMSTSNASSMMLNSTKSSLSKIAKGM